MTKSISWNSHLITFGLPVSIIFIVTFLANSRFVAEFTPEIATALTFDLVITVPIVYFLMIRKKTIPKITIVPFFIAGVIISSIVLPSDNREFLNVVKQWFLPAVELTVLTVIFLKVRRTIVAYKKEQRHDHDFFTTLKSATKAVLPANVHYIFATEIAVFYYSLFAWKKRKFASNEFTYHKGNGVPAVLAVFIFLILIETFAVHLLLQEWSSIAAWILTILSIYTGFQVLAILKSISRRPISVEESSLSLKYGIVSETVIPLDQIKSVEVSSKSLEFSGTIRHLSPLKEIDSHNVIIELKNQVKMIGFYGIKRQVATLAFHVDEKEKFFDLLQSKLG
ncbi:MAG: hypothetical protein ABJP45_11110 [Cyclobacteriaceae bacterium]